MLVYACLYPAWRFFSPTYEYLLARAYVGLAPLIEHPRKTLDARFLEHSTDLIAVPPYHGFHLGNRQLFIDLPILLALVLTTPGLRFSARIRLGLLAYLPLGLLHLAGLALTMHMQYSTADLLRERIQPGYLTLNLLSPLRRLIYSDLLLLLPFLVWGALYVRERQRPGR